MHKLCMLNIMKAQILKNLTDKIKQTNMIANYRKMYPYVRPYLFRAILALLLTLPLGAMDAVIAWVMKPYMDSVMIEKTAKATSLLPLLIIIFSFCFPFIQ